MKHTTYVYIPIIFSLDINMAKLAKQKLEEVKNVAATSGIRDKVLIKVQNLHTNIVTIW